LSGHDTKLRYRGNGAVLYHWKIAPIPAGQWSIRINDQWRVCFRFENGDALDVEIVDYH
jgi:plasmid maintenance system killer protein